MNDSEIEFKFKGLHVRAKGWVTFAIVACISIAASVIYIF